MGGYFYLSVVVVDTLLDEREGRKGEGRWSGGVVVAEHVEHLARLPTQRGGLVLNFVSFLFLCVSSFNCQHMNAI